MGIKDEHLYQSITTPLRTSRDRNDGTYSISVDKVTGRYNDRRARTRRCERENLIGERRVGERPWRHIRFDKHSHRPSTCRSSMRPVTQIPRYNAFALEEEELLGG